MKLLIVGANLRNKGAEAMLKVVANRYKDHDLYMYPLSWEKSVLKSSYPDIRLLPLGWSKLEVIFRLLISPHAVVFKLLNMLSWSDSLRIKAYGRFDAVVDISGYVYGGKWGLNSLVTLEKLLKYTDVKYVVLPQAIGPFDKDVKGVYLSGKSNLFLVARDDKSLMEAKKIPGQFWLGQSVDIVFSEGYMSNSVKVRHVAYAPSVHIENRLNDRSRNALIEFLNSISREKTLTLFPTEFSINDEDDDFALAQVYEAELVNAELTVNRKSQLKDIVDVISDTKVVIACRYHALVLALRMGIPVIALSWSHKYEMLLDSYGLSEFCIRPDDISFDNLSKLYAQILENYSEYKNTITSINVSHESSAVNIINESKNWLEI